MLHILPLQVIMKIKDFTNSIAIVVNIINAEVPYLVW